MGPGEGLDSEKRAVIVQWVIGTAVVLLAGWAALYTPSMSDSTAAEQSASAPQQTEAVGENNVDKAQSLDSDSVRPPSP